MSAVLLDQVQMPAGRAHLRLVVDNGPRPVRRERAAATPGRVVLTARGRWVVGVLAVAAVALLAIVLGVLLGLALRAPADGPTDVVTVEAGESLWSVAAAVAPAGEDVRDVVERIVTLNGLGGEALQPGQLLLVPAN